VAAIAQQALPLLDTAPITSRQLRHGTLLPTPIHARCALFPRHRQALWCLPHPIGASSRTENCHVARQDRLYRTISQGKIIVSQGDIRENYLHIVAISRAEREKSQ